MIHKALIILVLATVVGCKNKEESGNGKIIADLSELKIDFDGVVIQTLSLPYLQNLAVNDTLKVTNKKFEYQLKVKEAENVYFTLLKNKKKIGMLGFINKYEKDRRFANLYCSNNEDYNISVDLKYPKKEVEAFRVKFYLVNYEGQKETDLNFEYNNKDLASKDIKKNPNSYAIIHNLFFQKEKMSKNKLRSMMSLFSNELKQSISYNKLEEYLKVKKELDKNGYAKNFNWNDLQGKSYDFAEVLNNKKYMVLVFWASWCGPCRAEIPKLKTFDEQYRNTVSLVSLSVDDDYKRWKDALEKEKMPWINLSGLPQNKDLIKKTYNISSIPKLMLLDSDGKMLLKDMNTLEEIKNYLDLHK